MKKIFPLILLAGFGSAAAQAQFEGTGEFGLVVARGNTDSETLNARLGLDYERERWQNESSFSLLHARDSGETNNSRLVLANKTNYSINERSYVLGALRYDRDRFSSYHYQASASLGYGRRLIDNEKHRLRTEIGPGVRFVEDRETMKTDRRGMLRAFADYRWQISETAELKNRLLIEAADDNTFAENELGLSVAINSRLSMKGGVAVRHNTDVEPGTDKTDTLTTLNLVYNFHRG